VVEEFLFVPLLSTFNFIVAWVQNLGFMGTQFRAGTEVARRLLWKKERREENQPCSIKAVVSMIT
jgi:hypothetical protein